MNTEKRDYPEREYRSVGRFSAAEVRNLAPGPLDAIALGCPPALFAEVLEKRAAFRGDLIDEARRLRLKQATARIEAQDRQLAEMGMATPTDNDRKRHAEDVAARIYNDEVAEFMKPKIFG